VGRSADPRVTEARIRRLRTHGVPYLRHRRRAPSQTWRTFLANHLGDLAFTSMVKSPYEPSDDDGVHTCGVRLRLGWSLRDGPYASNQWTVVDWPPSLQGTSLGWRIAQNHLHRRRRTRPASGKDPPTARAVARVIPRGVRAQFFSSGDSGWSLRSNATMRSPDAESLRSIGSLNVVRRTKHLRSDAQAHVSV
jgi:hypothetical protein